MLRYLGWPVPGSRGVETGLFYRPHPLIPTHRVSGTGYIYILSLQSNHERIIIWGLLRLLFSMPSRVNFNPFNSHESSIILSLCRSRREGLGIHVLCNEIATTWDTRNKACALWLVTNQRTHTHHVLQTLSLVSSPWSSALSASASARFWPITCLFSSVSFILSFTHRRSYKVTATK